MAFGQTETYANLAGGPAWAFHTADLTVAVPAKLDDIVALTTPYAPKTGWIFAGPLSRSAMEEIFAMTEADVVTAHTNVVVAKRVTGTSRKVRIPYQDLSPAITQLAENTPASVSIAVGAGGSGTPAQTAVDLGNVARLNRRRMAFIVERDPGVTGVFGEGGARGQLFGLLAYQVGLSAAGSTLSLDPDTTAERIVEFDFYPETTITDPLKEHGRYVFETGLTVP